jgi:hypothetical protein
LGGNLAEEPLSRLHIVVLDVRTLAPEKLAPTRIEVWLRPSEATRQPHLKSAGMMVEHVSKTMDTIVV